MFGAGVSLTPSDAISTNLRVAAPALAAGFWGCRFLSRGLDSENGKHDWLGLYLGLGGTMLGYGLVGTIVSHGCEPETLARVGNAPIRS